MASPAQNADPRPRRRRRWAIAGILLALILAPLPFSDRWMAGALAFAARRASGWNVSIRNLRLGLRPPRLRLEDLAVANPRGFPGGDAFRIRELYIEYDRAGTTAAETRLRELRLNIAQVALHRRADGVSNFDELLRSLPAERPAPPPRSPGSRPAPALDTEPAEPEDDRPAESSEPRAKSPPPRSPDERPAPKPAPPPAPKAPPHPQTYRIERLTVILGTLEFQDLSAGAGGPALRIPLNRTYVFTNVTDIATVSDQLLFALTLAATPQLFEQLLGPLFE